ncbi:MAG: hypothetical protein KA368_08365 [Acidobacteria bacterium]|nr:hypothetical protein [Acidobacteriota bacterium]
MKFQIPFSKTFNRIFANARNSRLFPFAIGIAAAAMLATALLTMNGGAISAEEFRTLQPLQDFDESEGEARRREDWFYYQRAYPAKNIPPDASLRMREQLDQEEALLKQRRSAFGLAAEPQQQAVWAALGPAPISDGQTFGFSVTPVAGRVSAIVLDPGYNGTTNQTVYVGAAQGGVWRSIDNGTNWTPLMDNQPSLAVGAIAIDPNNSNVIYVGTGEGNRSGDTYYGQGLLKSTDGGSTWQQITGPVSTTAPNLPAFINCSFMTIEIDPSNTQTLYAATNIGLTSGPSGGSGVVVIGNRGIWKSTDGGINWRNLNPGNFDVDRTGTDVLVDPRKPQRVFAAILNLGIYRSEQGGEPNTWTLLSGGLPLGNATSPTFQRVEIAAGPPIQPSTESTLYAAFAAASDNLMGIWRSTDGGNNWSQVATPQTSGQANYNLELTVDPTDANIVYYGTSANSANNGGTVFRSTNGGQSWSDLSRGDSGIGLHADTHAIAVSPANHNILFTGNDGGVWRTNNSTANTVVWQSMNSSLNITQFQGIALHPTNPNFVVGGTQDNGTNLFTGQLSWSHIRDGDGGFTLIDQSNPLVIYHTFFNQNNSGGERAQIGPEISLNGGNTWSRRGCFGCSALQGNFNPADRVGFYAPMAQNTGFTGQSGNVIYFGTHRLYRSSDQGASWTGLGTSSDGFGTDLTKGTGRMSAIAAHPSLANGQEIVWAGANDGSIQITTNAGSGSGATFTNLTKAPLPNRFLTDIALDKNNAQRAVVTFSGFNSVTPATPGHVFLTFSQGQSWADISGNLPDVPVTSAAINPNDANTIYIGTDLGVFQTTNGGSSWERLGNGMPRVATYMVRYHAATNTLYAATHGRGVFRLTTSRALATVSAASFSASAIAAESIVAAFGTGLATRTEIAGTVPLPTVLAGTRVVVRDALGTERFAPLFFVAATQVNFLIPPGTAAGTATINITSDDGTVSSGAVQVSTVAPTLFAANSNGREVAAGFALRLTAAGAQINEPINRFDAGQNKFVSVPIDLGIASDQVYGVLFGSGFRNNGGLANVSATVGGTPAMVQYAGPQGGFVGLDQVNILLPKSLTGRGEVDVVLTVGGKTANTLRVNIK